MSENKILGTMWDDNPIDITQEANFIYMEHCQQVARFIYAR